MDDKIFELMEKMYSEVTNQLKQMDKKLDAKADKTDIVRMENDLQPKVEIALEGYKAVSEKLTTLEQKIDNLAAKVENHDTEIAVIKGGKRRA